MSGAPKTGEEQEVQTAFCFSPVEALQRGGVVETGTSALAANANSDNKFEVQYDAGKAGKIRLGGDRFLVVFAQRIAGEGVGAMWESTQVDCVDGKDGVLTIRVTLFHPSWEEGREVARIESRPEEGRLRLQSFSVREGDW